MTRAIMDCGGNIEESRMTTLGAEVAMLMLVSGNWHTLDKLEKALDKLGSKDNLTFTIRKTDERAVKEDRMPYMVDAVSLDDQRHLDLLCASLAIGIDRFVDGWNKEIHVEEQVIEPGLRLVVVGVGPQGLEGFIDFGHWIAFCLGSTGRAKALTPRIPVMPAGCPASPEPPRTELRR